MIYQASLVIKRLHVTFPQEPTGYDYKRKTAKRKSTLYYYKDGSHVESRNSQFIAWSPNHDWIARCSKWHSCTSFAFGASSCFFEYDEKTGQLVGNKLRLQDWLTYRIDKTIVLDADSRLNVLKRIDNVALWLGIPRPTIRYLGIINRIHRFDVSCGSPNRDPNLYPTFL